MPSQTSVYNLNKPTVAGDPDTWGGSTGLNGTIDKTEAALKATATTGSSNAYVLSSGLSLTAYATGLALRIIPNFTNSGAATINVDGLGTKDITKTGSTALASGDLTSGRVYTLIYDGTRFQAAEINSLDPTLATIAALTPTTDQMIYFTGSDTAAVTGINSSARTALASFTAAGSAMATAANAGAQAALLTGLTGSLNVQTFTGSGTWTRPSNAQLSMIMLVGGGGGGGSGGRDNSGGNSQGSGSGGGGGKLAIAFIVSSSLGSTESVTIGTGGSGGVAQAANANGNNGSVGGTSTFGTWLSAFGGGGGGGGTGATVFGGAPGGDMAAGQTAPTVSTQLQVSSGFTGSLTSGIATLGSGTPGGSGVASGVGEAGINAIMGPTGGGGGGGGVAAGGAGGSLRNATGGTAGTSGAGAGGAGNTSTTHPVGSGGGGGGGSGGAGTAGGTGGAGARGGGGGGGGVKNSTGAGSSGAGGAGGDGYCVVYTWVFA